MTFSENSDVTYCSSNFLTLQLLFERRILFLFLVLHKIWFPACFYFQTTSPNSNIHSHCYSIHFYADDTFLSITKIQISLLVQVFSVGNFSTTLLWIFSDQSQKCRRYHGACIERQQNLTGTISITLCKI